MDKIEGILIPILIAVFGGGATVIAWFGKPADNRFKGTKKIKKIGWWTIVLALLSLLLIGRSAFTTFQDQNALIDTINVIKNNSASLSDSIRSIKRNSDSLIIADSAIKSMLNTIAIHSDENGKLFISRISQSQESIKRTLRDSSSNVSPSIFPATGPLEELVISDTTITFKMIIWNTGSVPGEHFRLDSWTIYENNGRFSINQKGQFYSGQTGIPALSNIYKTFSFNGKNLQKAKALYLLLDGTCYFKKQPYKLLQNFLKIDLVEGKIWSREANDNSAVMTLLRSKHLLKLVASR